MQLIQECSSHQQSTSVSNHDCQWWWCYGKFKLGVKILKAFHQLRHTCWIIFFLNYVEYYSIVLTKAIMLLKRYAKLDLIDQMVWCIGPLLLLQIGVSLQYFVYCLYVPNSDQSYFVFGCRLVFCTPFEELACSLAVFVTFLMEQINVQGAHRILVCPWSRTCALSFLMSIILCWLWQRLASALFALVIIIINIIISISD